MGVRYVDPPKGFALRHGIIGFVASTVDEIELLERESELSQLGKTLDSALEGDGRRFS